MRTRHRRIIPLIVGIIFLLFTSASQGADLSINVRNEQVITSGTIRLQDLAQIACDQPDLMVAASLSEVIPEGDIITPEDIVSALATNGIGGITLKLTMADSVCFREESPLEKTIRRSAGWSGTVEIVADRPIPSHEDLIDLDGIFPGSPSLNLKFRTSQGDQVLPVRLKWLIPAVVAYRPVRRGTTIGPSDLAISTIEYQRNRRYYSDPKVLVGMEATRDTAKGEPFTARTTDNVAVVKSGSPVSIVHKKGSLIVTAPGRAMESGSIGDVVKVRNQRTRSIISGIVTGPDTVEVTSDE